MTLRMYEGDALVRTQVGTALRLRSMDTVHVSEAHSDRVYP